MNKLLIINKIRNNLFSFFHKGLKIIVLLYQLTSLVQAQSVEIKDDSEMYSIANIYNFKKSILSLTFDDGVPTQFSDAVPLLNERNLPATFYIITGGFDINKNQMLIHEIGSHTVNHLNLKLISRPIIEYELEKSKNDINSYFGPNTCLTMAYPFGGYNDSIIKLVKKYYLAARSIDNGYNNIKTFNKFKLKSFYYGPEININHLKNIILNVSGKQLWMIIAFHGINGLGASPINLSDFTNLLDFLKVHENQIWVASILNVIKYTEEARHAKISFNLSNDSIYSFTINDNLDDDIYNHPLSIKVKVPAHWENVEISGGKLMKIESVIGGNYVYFNALPNRSQVVLRPSTFKPNEKSVFYENLSITPNPFNDFIDESFQVNESCRVVASLCDMNGIVLQKEKEISNSPCTLNIQFDTSNLGKGVYLLRIVFQSNSVYGVIQRKLIKVNDNVN